MSPPSFVLKNPLFCVSFVLIFLNMTVHSPTRAPLWQLRVLCCDIRADSAASFWMIRAQSGKRKTLARDVIRWHFQTHFRTRSLKLAHFWAENENRKKCATCTCVRRKQQQKQSKPRASVRWDDLFGVFAFLSPDAQVHQRGEDAPNAWARNHCGEPLRGRGSLTVEKLHVYVAKGRNLKCKQDWLFIYTSLVWQNQSNIRRNVTL